LAAKLGRIILLVLNGGQIINTQLLQQARVLDIDEQIELVEAIWDGIVSRGAAPPLTEAQKTELDRRLADHLANPPVQSSSKQVRGMRPSELVLHLSSWLKLNVACRWYSKQPLQFAIVRADIRRVVANRFPYNVYFRAEDHRIVVLAVFHDSKDPEPNMPQPERGYNAILFFQLSVPRPVSSTLECPLSERPVAHKNFMTVS